MRTLLVHSTRQHGHDPFIAALQVALATDPAFEVRVADADDRTFSIGSDPAEYDLVVCVNATRWFSLNRLAIRGNLRVALCSFTGDDVHKLLLSADMLLSQNITIFTNCYALQQQLQPSFSVFYVLKPVAFAPVTALKANEKVAFGCVLPNIADRDFSLIETVIKLAHTRLDGPIRFPIVVPKDDKARFPRTLEQWRVPVEPALLYSSFAFMRFYIPAVRLTDLKVGTVPFELWQAEREGLGILLPKHPLLSAFTGPHVHAFSSLMELQGKLEHFWIDPDPMDRRTFDDAFGNFVNQLKSQCIWRVNAPSAGTEIPSGADRPSVSRVETLAGSQLVVASPHGGPELPPDGNGVLRSDRSSAPDGEPKGEAALQARTAAYLAGLRGPG